MTAKSSRRQRNPAQKHRIQLAPGLFLPQLLLFLSVLPGRGNGIVANVLFTPRMGQLHLFFTFTQATLLLVAFGIETMRATDTLYVPLTGLVGRADR
jgi:hypothetical protein